MCNRSECAVQYGHRLSRDRMVSREQLSVMIKHHLGLLAFGDEDKYSVKWAVYESPLGGRGLVATQDIKAGEVLFVDYPLVYGPRSGIIVQRGCTVCKNIDSDIFFKCSKCALILCSVQCQNSDFHSGDCSIISRWPNKVPIEEVDDTLLSRALTAIRALLLNEDQKYLLTSLQANKLPQYGSEIRDLKQYFDIPLHEEEFMILVICILNTNAFQMATPYGKKEMSLRGLYPVASILNHNCVPNTRNCFNDDLQMTVKATKTINAGSEIFTCYSGMLWGTPARRLYLYKSKHFLCDCERCADPTERGTLLAALKCFSTECQGSLLPIQPLKTTTAWRCLECGMRVPNDNICVIQSALGSLMGSLDLKNVDELENFYLNRITRYVPRTNQIVLDLQCRLVWELGETDGLRWNGKFTET